MGIRAKLRRVLPALWAVLVLIPAGCGGAVGDRDREAFLKLRTSLLEQGEVTLRADLRADHGDRVYACRLCYTGGAEGGLLQVEEPLELRDVSVRLAEGEARFLLDGLQLDTGALVREASPLQAFPLQLRAWLRGSVTQCWHETLNGISCVAAEMDVGGAGEDGRYRCRVWFSRETGSPVYSEIAVDGRVCLMCSYLPAEAGTDAAPGV